MTPEEREELLDLAILEYMQAQDRGQPPPMNEFLERHAEIRQELLSHFGNAEELQGALQPFASTLDGGQQPPTGSVPRPTNTFLLRSFGDYVIDENGEIARGGMGAIYRAYHQPLKRDVAIKVMLADPRTHPATFVRFLEEAQIIGQLQHPGIAPVHESGMLPDGRPFFVMKLIRGRTLEQLLNERPNPQHDLTRFLAIFQQICHTVAYAHSKGVLHRDLKPLNIMVGSFGEVQVMDWGLGKIITTKDSKPEIETIRTEQADLQSQAGFALGTYAYMPPEQANGDHSKIGPASDVYSLGGILCAMLTGVPPHNETSPDQLIIAARSGDITNARERLATCGADADLINLTLRCLAADPGERPSDASVLEQAITDYTAHVQEKLRQAEIERAKATVQIEADRRRRKIQLALLSSLALLVTLVTASVLWWRNDRELREQENLNAEAIRATERKLEAEKLLLAEENNNRQKYLNTIDRHRRRFALRDAGWRTKSVQELSEIANLSLPDRNEAELKSAFAETLLHWDTEETGVIQGPFNDIRSIAMHPSGKYAVLVHKTLDLLAVGSLDIINLQTKQIERKVQYKPADLWGIKIDDNRHRTAIDKAEFSEDGKWLVGATRTGRLYTWQWEEVLTAPQNRFLPPRWITNTQHEGISGVQLSATMNAVFTYSQSSRVIKKWQLNSGLEIGSIQLPEKITKMTLIQNTLTCSINNDKIYYIAPHTFQLIDKRVTSGRATSGQLTFSSDGSIVTQEHDNEISIRSPDTLNQIARLVDRAGSFNLGPDIWGVDFSSDLQLLAVTASKRLLIYETLNNQLLFEIPMQRTDLKLLAKFIPHSHTLVICEPNSIRLREIVNPIATKTIGRTGSIATSYYAPRQNVCVTLANAREPNNVNILTCWSCNIDVSTQSLRDSISTGWIRKNSYLSGFASIAVSHDGQWVATTSSGTPSHQQAHIMVTNFHTGITRSITPLGAKVWQIAFAVDGTLWIAVEKRLECWDINSATKLFERSDSSEQLLSSNAQWTCMVFGEGRVSVGESKGLIRQFSTKHNETSELKTVHAGKIPITSLATCGEYGTSLLVGNMQGDLFLFDKKLTQTGSRLNAHSAQITCLQAIDEEHFVSGGLDGFLRFWRIDSSHFELELEIQSTLRPWRLDCSADRRQLLITYEHDHCVRLLDLTVIAQFLKSKQLATNWTFRPLRHEAHQDEMMKPELRKQYYEIKTSLINVDHTKIEPLITTTRSVLTLSRELAKIGYSRLATELLQSSIHILEKTNQRTTDITANVYLIEHLLALSRIQIMQQVTTAGYDCKLRAIKLLNRIAAENPNEMRYRKELYYSHIEMLNDCIQLQNTELILQLVNFAESNYQSLVTNNAAQLDDMAALVRILSHAGNVLRNNGEHVDSLRLYMRSASLADQLIAKFWINNNSRSMLAKLYLDIQNPIMQHGTLPQSIRAREKCRQLIIQMQQQEANNAEWDILLYYMDYGMAFSQLKMYDFAGAKESLGSAINHAAKSNRKADFRAHLDELQVRIQYIQKVISMAKSEDDIYRLTPEDVPYAVRYRLKESLKAKDWQATIQCHDRFKRWSASTSSRHQECRYQMACDMLAAANQESMPPEGVVKAATSTIAQLQTEGFIDTDRCKFLCTDQRFANVRLQPSMAVLIAPWRLLLPDISADK